MIIKSKTKLILFFEKLTIHIHFTLGCFYKETVHRKFIGVMQKFARIRYNGSIKDDNRILVKIFLYSSSFTAERRIFQFGRYFELHSFYIVFALLISRSFSP